ncbi:uncharacterized protein LOC131886107 [Tigriopus californicus]|uniref:uncharacterized protein LOC131886107 n=1 Tax=Tigriopus californicus TaxID=6832 RepID=UPI0027DA5F5A|nr:uncharacterized protein LOC131886107 [Tigriopus californicus]
MNIHPVYSAPGRLSSTFDNSHFKVQHVSPQFHSNLRSLRCLLFSMGREKIQCGQAYLNTDYFMAWEPSRQSKTIEILLQGDESLFDQDCRDLWENFGAKNHFSIVTSHKKFISKVYQRFRKCFPNVLEEQIVHHDDTKFSFIEVVGYTDRWVWQRNDTEIWRQAVEHHFQNSPHHPQYHSASSEVKFSFANKKDMKFVDMPIADLEESIIDMLACEWERGLAGSATATSSELATISPAYLKRYTKADRERVCGYLNEIDTSGL